MKQVYLVAFVCILFVSHAQAEQIKEENKHVRTWNNFANNILKLHKQQIKHNAVKIEKRQGGYSHIQDWHYQEEKYIDKDSGNLITLIQWDNDKPNQLHTIEHYLYDKQGRVIRDYTAAYLPGYHNAPTQTLISLHRYQNGLHAFRTFDASGYRIVERCQGTYKGKPYEILLDEDEIAEMQYEKDSVMQSAAYKACFGDLQVEAGIYLVPQ